MYCVQFLYICKVKYLLKKKNQYQRTKFIENSKKEKVMKAHMWREHP